MCRGIVVVVGGDMDAVRGEYVSLKRGMFPVGGDYVPQMVIMIAIGAVLFGCQ